MVRVQRDQNVFPDCVRFFANEGNYGRQMCSAYCYPEYDDQIRLKLAAVGLGFQLSLEDAKHLAAVLDHAIRTLE